jgi:hypothetical protein
MVAGSRNRANPGPTSPVCTRTFLCCDSDGIRRQRVRDVHSYRSWILPTVKWTERQPSLPCGKLPALYAAPPFVSVSFNSSSNRPWSNLLLRCPQRPFPEPVSIPRMFQRICSRTDIGVGQAKRACAARAAAGRPI